jgi:hypothetical protein
VHIMMPESRKFYKLEEMWSDADLEEHNLSWLRLLKMQVCFFKLLYLGFPLNNLIIK